MSVDQSRRDLLKLAGVGAASAGLGNLLFLTPERFVEAICDSADSLTRTLGEQPRGGVDADWWVSAGGKDSNDGKTMDTPFRTFKRAIEAASSGHLIIVRGGTYHEWVNVNKPRLTFQNCQGERPVVDGEDTLPLGDEVHVHPETKKGFVYRGLVSITGEGVRWDGIDVKGSRGIGINVLASNVIVQNCTVHDCRHGCVVATRGGGSTATLHYVTILGVLGYDAYTYLEGSTGKLTGYPWGGVIMAKFCSNVEISNCTAGGRGQGIQVSHAIGGEVEGNRCFDNLNTSIWVYCSQGVRVSRNLATCSTAGRYWNFVGNGIGTGLDLSPSSEWTGYVNRRNTFEENLVIGRQNCFIYACNPHRDKDGNPILFPEEAGGLVECTIRNNMFMHANISGYHTDKWLVGNVVIEPASQRKTGGVIENTTFSNNLFLQDIEKAPMAYGEGHSKCTWDYNCWSPAAPLFAGPHDVVWPMPSA